MPIIAIAASYGAGGSVIAPRIAELSGLPYLSRGVVAGKSTSIGVEAGEASSSEEELERGIWQRVLNALASAPAPPEFGGALEPGEHPDRELRAAAEARIAEFRSETGGDGVILGWGATAAVPDALRIRLDGPAGARRVQGAAIEGIDEATAAQRLEHTDEMRRLFMKRLYHRDWNDPAHYHLWIDSTALPVEAVATVIVEAARAFTPPAP